MNNETHSSKICYYLYISFHFLFPNLFIYFITNFRRPELPKWHQCFLIRCIGSTSQTSWIRISLSLMFIYFIFYTPLNKSFHIFSWFQFLFFLSFSLYLYFLLLYFFFLLLIHLFKYSCYCICWVYLWS
jgi:hypothetical protein